MGERCICEVLTHIDSSGMLLKACLPACSWDVTGIQHWQ